MINPRTFVPSILSSDTTGNNEFTKKTEQLINNSVQYDIFFVIIPEQFSKLRKRLSTMQPEARIYPLSLFAGRLNSQFLDTSNKRTFLLSRILYQDFASTSASMSTPRQAAISKAIEHLPTTDPTKTLSMQALATFFNQRFIDGRNPGDLQQACTLLETLEQLRLGPCSGDFILDHFTMYGQLHDAYYSRYELGRNMSDLDLAITAMKKAMELKVPWWVSLDERPVALNAFACSLMERFKELGNRDDMDRALACVMEALEIIPPDHPSRLQYSCMRGWLLCGRCLILQDTDGMEEAIKINQELVDTMPSYHPDFLHTKYMLSMLLLFRFSKMGGVGLYDESSVDPETDMEGFRAEVRMRFSKHGADVEQVIVILRELLEASPRHPKLNYLKGGLAQALLRRFCGCTHLENTADLEEAIRILSVMSDESNHALDLGRAFFTRYIWCGRQPDDLDSAIAVLSDAATSSNIAPTERFFMAQLWSDYAMMLEDGIGINVTMVALKTAMEILPSVVWIGLAIQD